MNGLVGVRLSFHRRRGGGRARRVVVVVLVILGVTACLGLSTLLVLLDQTAPSVTSAMLQLGDASTIADGEPIKDGRVYIVSVVTDLSLLEMQITTNGSFTGIPWEPYTANKAVDLAPSGSQTPVARNIQARVRDGAMQFFASRMKGEGVRQVTVFNPLSWRRREWVESESRTYDPNAVYGVKQ